MPGPRLDRRNQRRGYTVGGDERDVPARQHPGETQQIDGYGVGPLKIEEEPAVEAMLGECALEGGEPFYG